MFLKRTVLNTAAIIGVAFAGSADRCLIDVERRNVCAEHENDEEN